MTEPVNTTPVPFSFFVSLCRELRNIKPRTISNGATSTSAINTDPRPLKVLRRWVQELHRLFPRPPPETTTVLFLFLFPEEDARRKYGMKETTLAKALVDVFGFAGDRSAGLERWSSLTSSSPSLGEKIYELLSLSSVDSDDTGGPSLQDLNTALDELASKSGFSASSLRITMGRSSRTRQEILRDVYRSLKPFEAAVMTQIILKDLRPILYPIKDVSTHESLLKFNSSSVHVLTLQEAMRVWDASGTLLRCYRVRSTIEDSILLFERNRGKDLRPQIGTPVEIPKCVKGYGCRDALKKLKSSASVWAETKYDGERMQIHVSVDERGSKVVIYSKSRRDSTSDRTATHWIIKEALGLQHNHSGKACGSNRHRKTVSSAIVEAEMVAYDKSRGIDEYWRIRHLVESTARGVRRRAKPDQKTTDSDASQHLAIVFFDVIYLNGVSLLSDPYSSRRETLEAIIEPIPTFAFIAKRAEIPLTDGKYFARALRALEQTFASSIANHEEGLILKASEATYADWRYPWVKLKRDYIPGLGDTIDFVLIGGCWDKDRGRILRVPTSTYTTFHVAAIDAQPKHPNTRPHLEVLFTVSYGLDRRQLEDLNFLIASMNAEHCDKDDLPYTFNLPPGCSGPRVLLAKPLLVEIFGAGFTKVDEARNYELRFPRISKVHRPNDRSWLEGVTLREFNEMALISVGINEDDCEKAGCGDGVLQDRVVNAMTCAEGTLPATHRGYPRRFSMATTMKPLSRKAEKLTCEDKKRRRSDENDFLVSCSVRKRMSFCGHLSGPLASITNRGRLLSEPSQHGPPQHYDTDVSIDVFSDMRLEPGTHGKTTTHFFSSMLEMYHQRMKNDGTLDDDQHTFAKFLHSSVILLDCCFSTKDHDSGFINQFVIPNVVHSEGAFALGCGWIPCATGKTCEVVRYGVVFVDRGTAQLWCNAPRFAGYSAGSETPRKPIFVFSVDSLTREALERGRLNEELEFKSQSLAVYL